MKHPKMRKQPARPMTLECVGEGVSDEAGGNQSDQRSRVIGEQIGKQVAGDEARRPDDREPEEDKGEARRAKPYNNPKNPTRWEVLDHELTHISFRDLC